MLERLPFQILRYIIEPNTCWHKNKHIESWNKTEVFILYYLTKMQKTNTGEKKASSENGGELDVHKQKNKTELTSITLHKN